MDCFKFSVILPQITDGSLNAEPLGVDGLRFWVAQFGCNGNKARIGKEVIEDVKQKMSIIRNSFRFLLGVVNGYTENKQSNKRFLLDRVRFLIALLIGFLLCLIKFNRINLQVKQNQHIKQAMPSKNSVFVI